MPKMSDSCNKLIYIKNNTCINVEQFVQFELVVVKCNTNFMYIYKYVDFV